MEAEEKEEKRRRGRSLSSYPVSIQIKTMVNAAEKFDEKNINKLIAELQGITERVKNKRKEEIERKIQELNEQLKSL